MTDGPCPVRDAALRYLRLGFSVIPIIAMDKHPALDSWAPFQKERPTEDQVRGWYSNGTKLGVAIVCGGVSGGLRIADFDSEDALRYVLGDPEVLARSTPVVRTGKGLHVYTLLKGGGKPASESYHRRGEGKTWLPLDVQGEGKYAVAPPSVHRNGRTYTFLVDGFDDILTISDEDLQARLKAAAEEWPMVEAILPAWRKEGARHNMALGFAALLRRAGFKEERGERVLRRLCEVAGDLEVEDRIHALHDTFVAEEDVAAAKGWLGDDLYGVLKDRASGARRAVRAGRKGEVAAHAEHVDRLMRQFTFVTLSDTEELLLYEDGVYVKGAESLVRKDVEMALFEEGDSAKKMLAEETVEAIKRRTYVDRKKFNPRGMLNLKNCVLDLHTLRTQPHRRDLLFTYQLPVVYDPAAPHSILDKFLLEVLPDERGRDRIQRWAGYTLEPGNPHQRALMLVGEGNNGKSTLLGLIVDEVGDDNVATETLQTLAENRYSAAVLWGKMANVCADIPASIIRYTGTFKMLVGGDRLRGEEKYRAPFSFANEAKLLFSANALPEVNDRSLAFWRRWDLIQFPVDLSGREDRDLPAKLRAERSGVLNWMLDGLKKVHESGLLSDTAADSLAESWKQHADPLYWFLKECTTDSAVSTIPKAEFYACYVLFCQEHERKPLAQNVLGERLRQLRPGVRQERPREKGPRPWMWGGLAWNEAGLAYRTNLEKAGPSGPPGPLDIPPTGPGPGGPSSKGVPNSAHNEAGPRIVSLPQPSTPCAKCFHAPSWRVSVPGETFLLALCRDHLKTDYNLDPEQEAPT